MNAPMIVPVSAEAEQLWNAATLADTVDKAICRIWLYREPAVVLGCAQRNSLPIGVPPTADAIPVLSRRSGGGAVLVGPWLIGVSICLHYGHPMLETGLAASYRWLGEAHVSTLAAFSIPSRAVPPGEKPIAGSSQTSWACFGSLSAWEVVSDSGRKIAGFAQIRRRSGVLFVGATLVQNPPWELMCERLGYDLAVAHQLRQQTVCCAEVANRQITPLGVAHALSRELGFRVFGAIDAHCSCKEATAIEIT